MFDRTDTEFMINWQIKHAVDKKMTECAKSVLFICLKITNMLRGVNLSRVFIKGENLTEHHSRRSLEWYNNVEMWTAVETWQNTMLNTTEMPVTVQQHTWIDHSIVPVHAGKPSDTPTPCETPDWVSLLIWIHFHKVLLSQSMFYNTQT